MFSTSSFLSDWKAIPTQAPAALKAGPPLLPALIAASTCGGGGWVVV